MSDSPQATCSDRINSDKDPDIEITGACEVCGLQSTTFCRNCCKTYYCCRQHQKSDWKLHKKYCYPVKLEEGGKAIKNLVATRNILQNEIFLKEEPVIRFPHNRTSSQSTENVCLECCTTIENDGVLCSDCGWELCCTTCQKQKYHTPECQIFSKCEIKPEDVDPEKINKYLVIGMIRTLLMRDTDQAKWAKIKNMNGYQILREDRGNKDSEPYILFIRGDCKLVQFEEAEVDFVYGVVTGNCLDISNSPSSSTKMSLLFPIFSPYGPSCIPNARFCTHDTNTGSPLLKMVATVSIAQGDSINVPFEVDLEATLIRRPLKERAFYYECTCERCKDPTELGTYLGAIKCKSCKTGYYVQPNPMEKESEWMCTDCQHGLINKDALQITEEASDMLVDASSQQNMGAVEKILKCISKLKKELLHPSHFVILDSEMDVCKRLVSFGMTDVVEKAGLITEMSKHILRIADVLSPGKSRLRGHALYYLQFGIVHEILRENMVNLKLKGNRRKLKEGFERARKKRIEECIKYQEEVREIFEKEPTDSMEFIMLNAMTSHIDLAISQFQFQ